ncbi:hypothetical protein ACWPKO_23555 (plasmid) [Coraliomargarita sp. W4R53]
MDENNARNPGLTPTAEASAQNFAIAAGASAETFTRLAATSNTEWETLSASRIAGAASSWLTAHEVADLLDVEDVAVQRMRARGDLVEASLDKTAPMFPRWQFTEAGTVLPFLSIITPAFPTDFHPLDIELVMTSRAEELHGATPREHLAAGGPARTIIAIIEGLSVV